VIDPTAANRQGVTAVLPDQYRLPYKIQWNFLVEHQFANDLSMSFAYVANSGRHLYASQNLNQLPQQFETLPLSLLTSRVDSPAAQAAGYREPFPGFTQLWGAQGTVAQSLRPFPQYAGVSLPIQARQTVWPRVDRHGGIYVVEVPYRRCHVR
jgi:hypothetical protein